MEPAMPTSVAIATAPKPLLKIGSGRKRPRLLRKTPPTTMLSRISGQRLEHGVVPEQQLQQQRQISDGLDVAAGNL